MIQGHRNPFGRTLEEYTPAELDFVLEMSAIDDPDHWVFLRNGQDGRLVETEARAGWASVLAGRMLQRYREATGTAAASGYVAAWYARRARGMRAGMTRGGKAIDIGGGSGHGA